MYARTHVPTYARAHVTAHLAESLRDDKPAQQRGDGRGDADEKHARAGPRVTSEGRRDNGADARRSRAEAERGGAHLRRKQGRKQAPLGAWPDLGQTGAKKA